MIAKTMRSSTPTKSSVMASSWGSEDLSMWIHRETGLADAFADSVVIRSDGDHNNGPFASWCERARHHEWLLRDNRDEATSSDAGLQMWLHNTPQQQKEEKEQRVSDPKLSAMVASAQELEMWLIPKERRSSLSDDLNQWLASKNDMRDDKYVMQSGREEDSASSIVVIDHDDFVMTEDTMDCDQDKEDLGFWLL